MSLSLIAIFCPSYQGFEYYKSLTMSWQEITQNKYKIVIWNVINIQSFFLCLLYIENIITIFFVSKNDIFFDYKMIYENCLLFWNMMSIFHFVFKYLRIYFFRILSCWQKIANNNIFSSTIKSRIKSKTNKNQANLSNV